jgi:hypothetical protein
MVNRGFVKYIIQRQMQDAGIDTAYFDEHEIDDTLTVKENLAHLREVYHIDTDLDEKYSAEIKKAQMDEDWDRARQKSEDYGDAKKIKWGPMRFRNAMGEKEKLSREQRFANKIFGSMERRVISSKETLKTPTKPKLAKYIPKPIAVSGTARNILGIPDGMDLKPLDNRMPTLNFNMFAKPDKKKKFSLFD